MTAAEQDFGKLMHQLQSIVDWYEQQEELDLEEGLKKAKLAGELIRQCSQRLSRLENEFVAIKADLQAAAGPEQDGPHRAA